jgi:Rrf2 family transcriptional regulator, iron-sulfur cluster assembly transcription factor
LKLSTKTRYGTRMIIDLAQNYNNGPVQLSKIAKRQDISVKYLEVIITPLKKAGYIKSVRGAKGGHMLTKDPKNITIGEIVALLEGSTGFTECSDNTESCERAKTCLTRNIWKDAAEAMYEKLYSKTIYDILEEDDQTLDIE